MKKVRLCFLFLGVFCSISIAQVTYNWNSFPAGGSSYSNTQGGGCTMNTTVNGVEYNGSAPRFDNAVGTNGAGLFLDQNWTTTNSVTDVVSNFAPALSNPSFTLFDINHNANNSDFCSSAWKDSVFISAVGATAVSFTQTNPVQQTLQIVGATLKIVGNPACNQATQGSITVSFTGPVTQITIRYLSGRRVTRCSTFTPCGASVTPPCATLVTCADPARQFITIGNITGSSCCSGPTSAPTSVSGAGPFCVPTTVNLSATGAFANSQWHAGSCGSPVIGTGTSISVTPTVTTTYYVNNLDCNNNPTGCIPITITINTRPATPTISNTGLTICSGRTTTLTSSSATGNTWSTGSTAQSIVVSSAGTYTLAVTNGFGCTSNPASVNVTSIASPPIPTISASGPLSFCPGNNVVLSSSSATGNLWSNGATTQTILVNSSGSFTVTVTNGGGCSTASAIINTSLLPNPPIPTISNTGLTICTAQSTTLTSSSATGNNWSNGSTSQSIIVNTTGTYSLFVIGANTCVSPTRTVTVNVIAPPLTPTITSIGSPTFCSGNSIILNSSNAIGNVWNTGATTQTILVNASGNYSVTTGSGACASSSSIFTVNVLPLPATPIISSTGNFICSGETTTLTSSSLTNNNWSNGSTNQSIIVNTSGTYSLYVNAINGCLSPTTSVVINVIAPPLTPTITSSSSNTLCSGNSMVLSSSNATGNVWNTGATTQTILVNASGNYSVTTGSGVCAANSLIFSVNVLPLIATPSITTSSNNLCAGQSATLSSSSAVNNIWSNGSNQQSMQVNVSGTYSLTILDVNGCSSPTATISIVINNTPLTVLVPSNVIACNNSIVAAQNFTSSTGANFAWQNSNSTIGLGANGSGPIPSFNAINSATTSGNAIITVTPTILGCNGAPSSFTISINPSLIVNAGINDTLCFGETKQMIATPNVVGYTYSWLPPTSLSNSSILNPIANPSITTVYTLTVTDANNCFGTDAITLFVNTQINSVSSSSNVTCFSLCNGNGLVNANGGNAPYLYSWSNGQNLQTASNLCFGNYSVTVKDSWNCLSSNTITITQPSKVTASISNFSNTLCYNSCNGSALGGAIGGVTPYVFSWNSSPNQLTAQATNLCAGNYILKVIDANNCRDSVSVLIIQPNPVTITPSGSVTICNGASTNLSVSAIGGSGNNYTYTWTPSSTLSNSTAANVIATPVVNTTYSISASDNNGCISNMVSIAVVIRAPLSISANNASYCYGNSSSLSTTVTGGDGTNYTYVWNPTIGLSNSTISNPNANPLTTTVYSVTVYDGCSIPAVTQLTVNVLPLPDININSLTKSGCAPLCVNFLDQSTVTNSSVASWLWSFGNNQNSTIQNPQNCFDISGEYSITLTVTSINGCIATKTFSNYITVFPNPIADFSAPEEISISAPDVQFVNNSIGATQWFWNFNDPFSLIAQQTSTIKNPNHTFSNQGIYCVNLTVKNTFGCTDTITKCIEIKPEFSIYVPNAFTPNGDNINDIFTAAGINIIEFEMFIFDRWGEEIFKTNDIKKGWDGVAKKGPEQSKQDVYVWKIKATDIFNKNHVLIGSVTLLR